MQYWQRILFTYSLFFSPLVWAGISLDTSRIIFQGEQTANTVTLTNDSEQLYLVQAKVLTTPNSQQQCPFVVTPPVFRLEKQNRNILRILRTGGNFAPDKESLCYLHFNLIPAQLTSATVQEKGAFITVGMRLNFKLFYRPDKLTPTVTESYGLLTAEKKENTIQIANPTPYYQSLAQLCLANDCINLNQAPSMIAPYSSTHYQEKKGHSREVYYRLINDYGGETQRFSKIIKE